MKRIRKELWLLIILILVMIPITSPQAQQLTANQEEEGAFLVGRIAYIEGELLRYVPDEEDWVATVKDAPFGLNDTLYSDRDARAEIIMPNNTWMRMDRDTQIQLIAIKDDVTEIDVVSGTVRFYNKSSDVTIKARTPFGYIIPSAPSPHRSKAKTVATPPIAPKIRCPVRSIAIIEPNISRAIAS